MALACLLLLLLPWQGTPAASAQAVEASSPRAASALLELVTDRRTPAAKRGRALARLAEMDGGLPLEPLLAMRHQVRKAWLADYARCLGRTGTGALETLHQIREKRGTVLANAEATFAIVLLDQEKGEMFASRVLRQASASVEEKVAALRGLSVRGSPFARVEALRRLTIAEGPLLLEAVRTLQADPDPGDIPHLIDLLEERGGRAANECVQLLQRLTGYRIGRDPRSWKFWMLKHKAKGTPFRRDTSAEEEEPPTLSYMGIPILGEKVVFVLDSSGSMNTPLMENYSRTRGQKAVEELIHLLPRLPEEASFDVIFFNSGVHSFGKALVDRSPENLSAIEAWLRRNLFDGSTNLHGGVRAAFEREGVEEIIVLSDGEPTAGELTAPEDILFEARRWNRWRNIRVNSISLGAPAPARNFLYRLAKDHDGVCRVID